MGVFGSPLQIVVCLVPGPPPFVEQTFTGVKYQHNIIFGNGSYRWKEESPVAYIAL